MKWFALCLVLFFALAAAQDCDPGEPFVQVDSSANVAFRLDPAAQADKEAALSVARSQPGLTNGQQLQVAIAEAMGIDVDAVVVYRVTSTDAAVAICTGDIESFLNEVNSQCLYYPNPFEDTILLNARVTGVSWGASCTPRPVVEPVPNGSDDDGDSNNNISPGEQSASVARNSVLVLTFTDGASSLAAGLLLPLAALLMFFL